MARAALKRDEIFPRSATPVCASHEVGQTLQALVCSARTALAADRATCYVYSGAAQAVSALYTTETDRRRRAFLETTIGEDPGGFPVCRAHLEREDPLWAVEDVAACHQIDPHLALRLRAGAFLAVRLQHASVGAPGRPMLLGSLFLSYRQPRRLSPRERSTALGLATIAGLALANARLHAETVRRLTHVERHAETDALTGLLNRSGIDRRLEAAVAEAARREGRLSALVLDLDDFKQVNDRCGRGAGDDCLRAVARAVEGSLTPAAFAGRLGGEEFVVVLPQTGAKGAWLVAERLRARLRDVAAPSGVVMSASFGVASLPEHATSAGELMRAADSAMHAAKAIGRDRSIVFSPAAAGARREDSRRAHAGREAYLASVLALARALDERDPSTHAHSTTVGAYAAAIAGRLGLDGDRVEEVRIAGLLHDVGKVGIADAVLQKPGSLTDAEWAEMRRHPEIGAKLLLHPGLAEVREWVLRHHERPDGRGYPGGLTRARIPTEAMILAVADAYEAMTADRPYRRALSPERARAELCAGRGSQFDERVVDAFLTCLDERGAAIADGHVRAGLGGSPAAESGA